MRPSPTFEDIADALRADPSLVVIDNAEHVLTGVCDLAAVLLEVPGVDVLVTSRTPLQLRKELVFPISTLTTAGTRTRHCELLHHLAPHEDLDHLAGLAARSEGVPLVLELLGSALRWQSAETLTTSFKRVTDLEERGDRSTFTPADLRRRLAMES